MPTNCCHRTLIAVVAGALVASHAARGQSVPQSQQSTIAEARARRVTDMPVTITGRATVSSGKLQSQVFDVAVQDATGGIRVFARTAMPNVLEGDSVVATGGIKSYRGNLELLATDLRVIPSARRTIAPYEMPIDSAIIAQHPGRLVRVRGRVAGSGQSEGGQWLRLRAADPGARGTLTVWVPANHGAPVDLARVRSEDSLVVTGVMTSYQDSADDPVVWQIVPRDAADVELTGVTRSPRWLLWVPSEWP